MGHDRLGEKFAREKAIGKLLETVQIFDRGRFDGGQVIGGSLINIWFTVCWWSRRSKFLGKHAVAEFRFFRGKL